MFVDQPGVDLFLRGILLTSCGMIWVVILVRVNGLRSFSKMTNFDFVMTVAVGSLLAGACQATGWREFAQVIVAMAALFGVQFSTALARRRSSAFERVVQNRPMLLMRDGKILENALQETRVAESDLVAKLREANVLDPSQVRAVVLETTGDISVLHGDSCSERVLQGVEDPR